MNICFTEVLRRILADNYISVAGHAYELLDDDKVIEKGRSR